MQIKLLIDGGDMKPGPVLSQKLGPVGININQVIQRVNDSTKNLAGLKIPVELNVNASTKEFDIKVFPPPVSELLKKEMRIEKGSGIQAKMQVANASIEQVISVAKTKFPSMLSKDLKAAVKTIVGTCGSLGILVENELASKINEEIGKGKYDKEIQEEKIETPVEKKKNLEEYFLKVKEQQEKIIKQEEEIKEAESEKKEETEETKQKTDKNEDKKK